MWCDRCRADAPATVSAETGRAACETCGQDLGDIGSRSTDQARELLKRWSAGTGAEPTADPPAEATSEPPAPKPATSRLRPPRPLTSTTQPTVSPAPDLEPDPAKQPSTAKAPVTDKSKPATSGSAKPRRSSLGKWPAPTVQMSADVSQQRRNNRANRPFGSLYRILGQLMAYLGILAITGGTALVIWGYFGGPAEYAPTGWLVATGGQMMLMLGVATLVSEGLEQSSLDLRFQVGLIDDRLERIERNAVKSALQNRMSSGPPTSAVPNRQATAV